MKLIVSYTSPYARKCRILVEELALNDKVEVIEAHPFDDGDVLLAANPLGRVPCLIGADGAPMTESLFITEVLIASADDPWTHDWTTRRLEALATGLIDLAVARRVEMVRDKQIYSDYWIKRREAGIARTLDVMESQADAFSGERSVEGLTAAIALDYLDFRYSESNWRADHPKLTALHERWNERESFQKTKPPSDG